ncbi:MAG: response regulator [Dehalococcoidia bacterium]|nr:response regulator [Dehalococcoidia bacterium]
MIPAKNGDPIIILLAEDNPADAELTMEAMRDLKIGNMLYHVSDGIEVMEFLRKTGKHAGSPRPDLILLDLNMPRKDGLRTLKEIKQDTDLKSIPVVILTISSAEEDIIKSYNLHANSYVTKPLELDEFVKVVKGIEDFWFNIVKLPVNRETPGIKK